MRSDKNPLEVLTAGPLAVEGDLTVEAAVAPDHAIERVEAVGGSTGDGGSDPEAASPFADADYPMLAMKVAESMRQVVNGGDELVSLLLHPELLDGFQAAFQALPDEVVPPVIKERLPIESDPNVDVRIITRSHLEEIQLRRHFGPVNDGGNGYIERLSAYLDQVHSPVTITLEHLRERYLSEIASRIIPQIHLPSARPQPVSAGAGRRGR